MAINTDYFPRNKQTISPFDLSKAKKLGQNFQALEGNPGLGETYKKARSQGGGILPAGVLQSIESAKQFGSEVSGLGGEMLNRASPIFNNLFALPNTPPTLNQNNASPSIPTGQELTQQNSGATHRKPDAFSNVIPDDPGRDRVSDAGLPYTLGNNNRIQFTNPDGSGTGTLDTGDPQRNAALAAKLNDRKGTANFNVDLSGLYNLPQTQQQPQLAQNFVPPQLGYGNYQPAIDEVLNTLDKNQSSRFDSVGKLISKKGNRQAAQQALGTLGQLQAGTDRNRSTDLRSGLSAAASNFQAQQDALNEQRKAERDAFYQDRDYGLALSNQLGQQSAKEQELRLKEQEANRPIVKTITDSSGNEQVVGIDPATGKPLNDPLQQYLAMRQKVAAQSKNDPKVLDEYDKQFIKIISEMSQ